MSGKMKILLIVPYSRQPWLSERSGGAQRSHLLCEALRRLGEVCLVVAMPRADNSTQASEGDTVRIDGLQQISYNPAREAGIFRILQKFLVGNLRRQARNLAICNADFTLPDVESAEKLQTIVRDFRPNLVVCRWLRWAVATGGAFISDIPVILDLDIVDWRVHGSQEEQMTGRGLVKRIHSQFYTRTIERNARRRLRQFAHVWVVSDDDRQIIGGQSCSVLPNVPILPASDGQRSASEKPNQPNILFVGDLGFSSNAHGLNRFLERVWPRLHEAAPELELRIVGRLPDGESTSIARWRRVPNVELVGFVEDLGVEYERALFTVAPIYWGGGTKIKVIESLGRGKTCVVTPHSLYGLGPHVRHGESVLCAPSDVEFADACLNLTRSEDFRQRLALKGRHTIREYFSAARFNDVVAETVQPFELPREERRTMRPSTEIAR